MNKLFPSAEKALEGVVADGQLLAVGGFVLVGREFWDRLLHFDTMIDEGTISPEDLKLFHKVDTPQEAWDAIQGFYRLSSAG